MLETSVDWHHCLVGGVMAVNVLAYLISCPSPGFHVEVYVTFVVLKNLG